MVGSLAGEDTSARTSSGAGGAPSEPKPANMSTRTLCDHMLAQTDDGWVFDRSRDGLGEIERRETTVDECLHLLGRSQDAKPGSAEDSADRGQSTDEIRKRLEALKRLCDDGLLEERECEAKRREILEQL